MWDHGDVNVGFLGQRKEEEPKLLQENTEESTAPKASPRGNNPVLGQSLPSEEGWHPLASHESVTSALRDP